MGVNFNNHMNSEVAVDTKHDKHIVYGPLDPKSKHGIEVRLPNGKVEKMTINQLLELIINNAEQHERTSAQDTFQKLSK